MFFSKIFFPKTFMAVIPEFLFHKEIFSFQNPENNGINTPAQQFNVLKLNVNGTNLNLQHLDRTCI